jgi:putative methionine-R-sulfoxide reductase with GAF domain
MVDATQLVKKLQEMRDDGFLSDALLREAVRSIKDSDDRFDWVGALMLNEEAQELWLHNYVGPRTEEAKVPVGEGIRGKAVEEMANQNVPDVSEVEHYIASDPNVSSELVVLVRAGDEIFGELAIDSLEPAAFTDEDEEALVLIADKLAEQIMAERR